MAEKLMCSNCGAPVTRTGTETSVACPHCQVVTEFPPVPVAAGASGSSGSHHHRRDRDDDDDDDDDGRIPNILIIQAPAAQQPVQQIVQRPIIVSGPGSSTTYVRRQRSLASYLVGPIFFIIIFAAVGAYVRSRAAHAVAEAEKGVHEAEKGAHEAEKGAEKAPEHKAPAKH